MASEYWIVSVPVEAGQAEEAAWSALSGTCRSSALACHRFLVPDLKVCTLDQLVGLADCLAKLDLFVEGVTRKVAQYLSEVLEVDRDKLLESLTADGAELGAYLARFQWDAAKYPSNQSLQSIVDAVVKQVSHVNVELKEKGGAYSALCSGVAALERRQAGSLLTRSLAGVVRRDHLVLDCDSDYLTTLLVLVPAVGGAVRDWEASYEKITEMVVPRSSQLLHRDHDYLLYTVTLFKKVADEFKARARERKFIVREYQLEEAGVSGEQEELARLYTEQKKHFGLLVRWLKVNFSECFMAWAHVKTLRVFVESVLRYGLPVNFVAALVLVQRRAVVARHLHDQLRRRYKHLDGPATAASLHAAAEDDALALGLGQLGHLEYHAYVCLKFSIDLADNY